MLVACEFSGIVRDAFIARGHDAWSCDLLLSERPGPHFQCDVFEAINHSGSYWHRRRWDLMIAHPPCTYLCNSGAKHLYIGGRKENGKDELRWQAMYDAAGFISKLLHAHVEMICIEQPIMIGYAAERIAFPVTQIIQPWQFGHGETKATCLRLKNLPKLAPTSFVEGREPRVHHASPGQDRWKERSRTLQGIAAAMAEQWGGLVQERAA